MDKPLTAAAPAICSGKRTGWFRRISAPDHPDIAMVLAVEGCPSACADTDPFDRLPAWIMINENQGDEFIRHIKTCDFRAGFL